MFWLKGSGRCETAGQVMFRLKESDRSRGGKVVLRLMEGGSSGAGKVMFCLRNGGYSGAGQVMFRLKESDRSRGGKVVFRLRNGGYSGARKVVFRHGGDIRNILQAAGKVDSKTMSAAMICASLVKASSMKVEQCIIALNYCSRSRVGFDEALEELRWENPRKSGKKA